MTTYKLDRYLDGLRHEAGLLSDPRGVNSRRIAHYEDRLLAYVNARRTDDNDPDATIVAREQDIARRADAGRRALRNLRMHWRASEGRRYDQTCEQRRIQQNLPSYIVPNVVKLRIKP